MNWLKANIIFIFFFSVTASYGQISPGDLSNSHKDIEGMSNCTQCHELGEKVLNSKCLDCHKDIQTLINQNRGFHANSTILKKDCFECHSDHHGRKFDMIRFDESNFDHNETNYELEGQHAATDCRKCHQPDNIQDVEIKKRPNTFLGLELECLSCHNDFHQNTLPIDCKQCHDMEAFNPATNFKHDDTDYVLDGKHLNVDCIECHKTTVRNGVEFQEFSNIPFSDCKSCHTDSHNNQLPGQCAQCHTETSFSFFTGQGKFNHNTTNFNLKGKHKKADCFSCHKETDNPKLVFQDNINTNENNCIECHDDKHEGKFGLDCAKCHNEKSFLSLNNMDFFDHNVTDYVLEGKHSKVDCNQCHKGRYSEDIDFSACKNCHDDYHRGEFSINNLSPDCVECHSLEQGFDYSLYTLEQHQDNSFPLEGAHYATPCYACHISEDDERWTFRELGSNCIDCHQDIHEGYISQPFYPENDCKTCHSNNSWADVTFNHNTTNWPLNGKHVEIDCRACHFIEISDNNTVSTQKFISLDSNCIACHENIHDNAFAINGETDCNRCHVTSSWIPENFNHNTTNFPLVGKHQHVECRACHTSSIQNGEIIILYKVNKFECIDCHQ